MVELDQDYSFSEEEHNISVVLTDSIYQLSNYSLHEAIPHAIMHHLKNQRDEVSDLFDIKDPCRLLTEGYEFDNGVVAEDFAISGSYEGGEMVIGQVVSSNNKDTFDGKPRDFIQAEYFEKQLSLDKSISPTINNVYSIRTTIPRSEVREREDFIESYLREEGYYELELVVHQLDTEEEIVFWPSD